MEASAELGDERHPVRPGGGPRVAAVGEGELLVVDVDAVVTTVGSESGDRIDVGRA